MMMEGSCDDPIYSSYILSWFQSASRNMLEALFGDTPSVRQQVSDKVALFDPLPLFSPPVP
jgi:hypothetical protein